MTGFTANGPNAQVSFDLGDREGELSVRARNVESGLPAWDAAKTFIESNLKIPEGPKAGEPMTVPPYFVDFLQGALDPETQIAVLSIGRGNAKTAFSAAVALCALLGVWDGQPRREIVIAARTREQGRIAFNFMVAFAEYLPLDIRRDLVFRKNPRLEIEYEGDGGGHVARVIAADAKSALGGAPVLVLMDERGHWPLDKGNDLEAALLSGLGKRGGRALIISTSAPDDAHPFSQWIDNPQPGVYIQEHRPAPGLPADDIESLIEANPGALHGIGSSIDWLEKTAKTSIARGGSSLSTFRLYNRNERVSGETRDLLLTPDEWLNCEETELPPRQGKLIVGLDLGGSASMSAAAYYWPETGRLEVLGTFPSQPTLLDRGQKDGVNMRYVEMQERGELTTLGEQTVPVAPWLTQVMSHVDGETVTAIIADRYKQAELGEALERAYIRSPMIWRSTVWKDSNEDCERFRRACFEGHVKTSPSLLLRSAFADAVVTRDDMNNLKLTKARSTGRIDPVQASVIAVAEGIRQHNRTRRKSRVIFA